jgi:hypothetical protein
MDMKEIKTDIDRMIKKLSKDYITGEISIMKSRINFIEVCIVTSYGKGQLTEDEAVYLMITITKLKMVYKCLKELNEPWADVKKS